MIRTVLHGLLSLGVLILALGVAGLIGHGIGAAVHRHASRVIVLDALHEVSELVLAERTVHQTITRELQGHLGGRVVYIEAVGVQRLGVNLRQARVLDIHADRQLVVLELPPIVVLHAELDHEATSISAYETGLWPLSVAPSREAAMIEEALREAGQGLYAPAMEPPAVDIPARLSGLLGRVLNDGSWEVRVQHFDPETP